MELTSALSTDNLIVIPPCGNTLVGARVTTLQTSNMGYCFSLFFGAYFCFSQRKFRGAPKNVQDDRNSGSEGIERMVCSTLSDDARPMLRTETK